MNQPNLESLQKEIGYHYKDQELLLTALTHRSCLNEADIAESYERLEFLGDAILEMLISDYLFKNFPDKQEGFLTAARSATVRTEALSSLAKTLDLGSVIRMSKGEESTGGRNNPSTLEDVVEALIGSLYIDGGLPAAKSFFDRYIIPMADTVVSEDRLKDAKSALQEAAQSKGMRTPTYKVVREIGPDHDKTFESAAIINGSQVATGIGKSKQDAEQKAAQKALKLI